MGHWQGGGSKNVKRLCDFIYGWSLSVLADRSWCTKAVVNANLLYPEAVDWLSHQIDGRTVWGLQSFDSDVECPIWLKFERRALIWKHGKWVSSFFYRAASQREVKFKGILVVLFGLRHCQLWWHNPSLEFFQSPCSGLWLVLGSFKDLSNYKSAAFKICHLPNG